MGLITISSALQALSVGFFGYKLVSFVRFYVHARRAGFPIYISPFFYKSIPFLILAPALQPYVKKYIPGWIYDRFEIGIHGWEFRTKRKYTEQLGNIFTVVTPDGCLLVYVLVFYRAGVNDVLIVF